MTQPDLAPRHGVKLVRDGRVPMADGITLAPDERLVWAGGGAQVRYRLPWAG